MRKGTVSKVAVTAGLALAVGVVGAVPALAAPQSQETSNPALDQVKWSYSKHNKSLKVSGTSTHVSKVILKYGSSAKKSAHAHANGSFSVSLPFKGYKTFSVYGTNKAGKRITSVKKISSDQYAANKPTLVKASRSKKGITYRIRRPHMQGSRLPTKASLSAWRLQRAKRPKCSSVASC